MIWFVVITVAGIIVKIISDKMQDQAAKIERVRLQSKSDIQAYLSRMADVMDDDDIQL